jgi:hypothetical protein
MIDADRLRSTFLAFFAERGHAILPSGSLIPEGDPLVLFTTAGVHSLVPYLRGRPHPAGRLLADCQKCLRTTDIAEVGDATHLTFFEMLGNWSLGAYFKRESITWSHEFLTREDLLAIPPQRLWISVFAGNQVAPAAGCHPRADRQPEPHKRRRAHPQPGASQGAADRHRPPTQRRVILGDQSGVLPGNQGRGYVLRRLIRRGVRACQTLHIQPYRWAQTADLVIDRYGAVYRELPEHADRISSVIVGECERFERWPFTSMTPVACPSSSPPRSPAKRASTSTRMASSGSSPSIGSAHDPNATNRPARPSRSSPSWRLHHPTVS